MFVDSATITCQAGKGGDGCNSYLRGKSFRHRSPNGGDGGTGGSVILVAKKQVHTLLDLKVRKTIKALEGKHGSSNHKTGANGYDTWVPIPVGTEVYNETTGHFLKDMYLEDESLIVCRGGVGGKGNHRRSESTRGEPGESKVIRLELKLIADIGLVGFPNAGKSTFISRVSNAKSKIAAYPFTTKEPILGVVKFNDGDSFVMADIPGLIERAHEGKGLGHRFLRHIERTRLFLHLVDMAATEGRDPADDFRVINEELANFSPIFCQKPQILVANKMDIPASADNLVKFKKKVTLRVHEISAVTGQGVGELIASLRHQVQTASE